MPRRFQDPAEWVAYAGTTHLSGAEASTVRVRVARITPHPLYNPDTADFDVAVLELDGPLAFGRHVQPVCLPAATHVFPPRRKCLISGWGYLKEDFRKSLRPCLLPRPGVLARSACGACRPRGYSGRFCAICECALLFQLRPETGVLSVASSLPRFVRVCALGG